jgi:hypothetical protein
MWPKGRGIGHIGIVRGLLGLYRGRTYQLLVGPQTKGRVLAYQLCWKKAEVPFGIRAISPPRLLYLLECLALDRNWACKLRMSGRTAPQQKAVFGTEPAVWETSDESHLHFKCSFPPETVNPRPNHQQAR